MVDRRVGVAGAAGAVAGVCAVLAACAGSAGSDADLVLTGGPVITLDEGSRVAEAVAVRGGRVVAVGTAAEIEAMAGPDTERVDLAGRAVTPGLMDAHVHFASGGASRLYNLDMSYPNVENIADVQRMVAEQAEVVGEGEWVRGGGWDEGKLEEVRYILAADLDEVAADRPVWLMHTMGHYGVANSVALDMAGITADTPDPPGGTIDRDPAGQPTGVLKESAMGLVTRLIPRLGPDQQREGIRSLADAFNAECMTGGKDPGITQSTWVAYADVLADGDLTVRIFALWSALGALDATIEEVRAYAERLATFTRPRESTGDDRLIAGGVKLYIDGSGGARTAWLYDDWNRDFTGADTGNRGYPTMDPDELRRRFRAYHDAGLPRQHPLDRRPRHRMDRRELPGGARGHAHPRPPPRHHPLEHPHRPRPRRHGRTPARLAGGLPGALPDLHLVDRRHLRRQLRPRARPPPQPVPVLPGARHDLGERVGLLRHAISGALRRLGVGGPPAAARRLRRRALRNRRIGGRGDRPALLHGVGRTPDVPGGQGRND